MAVLEKNPAQEEAIRTIDGQVLLISCPGSGKTTTMLRRIDHMIHSGINPKQVLMVTFTDAAAKEMKSRFSKQYGDAPVTFCTIHALCLRIMYSSGMASLKIMDASETMECLNHASKVSKCTLGDFKDIRNDIGVLKNTGRYTDRSEMTIGDQQFLAFVKAYEDYKIDRGLVDFDDLLILGKKTLTEHPAFLQKLRNQYQYLICDEYQDTNPIQKDILYLLAGKDGNICVVGDDDQSIYGFRGAVPSIMMDFAKDFPRCHVIRMATNYRSVPNIIVPASMLIKRNKDRFEKDIEAFRAPTKDGKIFYESSTDRVEEMDNLAKDVKAYAAGNYTSCAVLARTNMQLEQVAECFLRHKIPFASKDVVSDIYEHWAFQDICSYLRLADGSGDITDFKRIANRPARYVSFSTLRNLTVYDPDNILRQMMTLKPYVFDGIVLLLRQLKTLGTLPFRDRIAYVLSEIGYERYLEQYTQKAGLADVSLFAKCDVFKRDSAFYQNLNDWIKYANEHIQSFHQSASAHKSDGVTLATMHRSKGLEWDHVFIVDCCSGIVPFQRKKSSDGNGSSGTSLSPADLEEERRLFYVACTRARETLHIMSYRTKEGKKGASVQVLPSMFLKELQTPLDRPVTEKEKEQVFKKSRDEALSGFGVEDLSALMIGDVVHHSLYGGGRVRSNQNHTMIVLFSRGGLKIFKY